MAAFLAQHSPQDRYRYGVYSPTQFLEAMISCLQTVRLGVSKVATPKLWRIDHLMEEARSNSFSTTKWKLRRPKVVLDARINMRGGLSLLWHPNPKDFVAEDLPYHPSYSGRPLNEFLYFQEFERYADAMHHPKLEPWERALVGHMIFTFRGIIDEIVKEVGDYCEVRLANRLEMVRDSRGRITGWELVDQPEIDARKRAAFRKDKENDLERVRSRLDATLRNQGMAYSELIGRVEELRAAKMTYARVERHLVESGKMHPMPTGQSLQALVKDLKRLVAEKDALIEELNGLL